MSNLTFEKLKEAQEILNNHKPQKCFYIVPENDFGIEPGYYLLEDGKFMLKKEIYTGPMLNMKECLK